MHDRGDRRSRPQTCLLRAGWAGLVLLNLLSPAAGQALTGAGANEPPPAEATPRSAAIAATDADVPAYYFSPLRFSGQVSDDGLAADLVAEVEVHLTRDAGWYSVPLRMGQAIITGMTYEGPREPIPREPTEGVEDGLHWLFHGRGVHRLKLNLRVPLRRLPTGTNLQLTLPNVPRLFPTQLDLRVPAGSELLELSKDHQAQIVSAATGETRLAATIQGTRIDLTWRVAADRPGALTRAATAFTLDRDGERFHLTAQQEISTDGRVTDVAVRLPQNFRLVSVGGESYVSHAPLEGAPGWVRVAVRGIDRADLHLEWEFDADFPVNGGTVTIDGLETRDAVRQSGTLAIAALRGYRILRQLTGVESVHDEIKREDVSRVRTRLLPNDVGTAFTFARQPFALTLDVQETRLVLETRPRAVVTTAADGLSLDVEYLIRVDAGLAKELRLRWPERGLHTWTLRSDPDQVRITDATDAASEFPGEVRKLELPSPREGEFTVRLQFHSADPPGPFELTLPTIESDRQLPAWLLLRGRDSVEPQLSDETRLTALSDPLADVWLKGQGYDPDLDAAYVWERPHTPLTGQSVMHPLEVKANTVVRVERAASGRYRVEQQVNCDVHFGRIAELRFRPPKLLTKDSSGADLVGVRGRDLAGGILARNVNNGQLRFALPEPAQGTVSIVLEYYLPPGGTADLIDVPIFELVTTSYQSTAVEFPQIGSALVHSDDRTWRPVSTSAHPMYVSSEPRDRFTARLDLDVASAPQSYHVRQMLARVSYSSSGRTQTRVEWELESPPTLLVLQLPAGAENPAFTWEGVPLSEGAVLTSGDAGRFELVLSSLSEKSSGRLGVVYQGGAPGSWKTLAPLEAALPMLPTAVDVAESYLEIDLPGDHCLLTYPVGLSPRFRWQPGLIFHRVPTAEHLQRRRQIAPHWEESGAEAESTPYAFHTIGAASERYEFRAVGVWMLILFGSGLTLALAFLLWSAPATRNVLTVLVIGCIVAIAGVFAAEVVELLLQPVLLGLLAAAVAISMQSPPGARRELEWRESSTRSAAPAVAPQGDEAAAGVATTQVRPLELQESGSRR